MDEIQRLILMQKKFFKSGKTLDYHFRINSLKKLKLCIDRYEKEIKKALFKDLHKPDFEIFVSETGFVLKELDFVIKHLKDWTKPQKVSTDLVNFPAKSYIYRQPFGVTLIISPWNYPFHLSIMPLVGAIAAGNTAIIKPSELSVHTSLILHKMFDECFDKSYLSVVAGDINTAEQLLNEKFDKIFYTGGSKVGKIVAKKAAEHLIPLTLELGGKSPAVVLSDANLKAAAKRIVWGKFFNAGQTCVSVDYAAIEESIYKKFKNILVDEVKKYSTMKRFEENYSHIINIKHFKRLVSLIEKSKTIYTRGYFEDKLLIYPTLIESDKDDAVMQDEIFGPILPILRFKNYKEIREFITSRPRPLSMYLFSQSSKMKDKVLNEIASGGVTINDTLVHLTSSNLPFGGIGESGYGSYHGIYSFYEFSQARAVMDRSTLLDFPLRYPPYKGKLPLVKKLF